MNDPGRPDVPHPPYDELRNALGDDPEALAHVEALHAAMHAETPDADAVRTHASWLRGVNNAEARVANWWDDINTQRWLMALGEMGL